MTITINKTKAQELIHDTNGKIFRAKFTKKDGSLREMVCRLGVRKYVNGVGRNFNPSDYELIGVFDMQKDGHRMINIKTLQALTIQGKEYKIA
jgi:hypothetical protein